MKTQKQQLKALASNSKRRQTKAMKKAGLYTK